MFTVKITQKGQITIPVEFRKKLGTDIVELEMKGESIIIKPVKKLGIDIQEKTLETFPFGKYELGVKDIVREKIYQSYIRRKVSS